MSLRLLFALLLGFLLIIPVSAEEIDENSGPTKVKPEITESVQSVPINEETGTVDWSKYNIFPNGGGARFLFITKLYPPDPAALADIPEILLDSAWAPPIPLSFGFEPPTGKDITITGQFYLEDITGNLAKRDETITVDGNAYSASTWFLGQANVFHIEESWNKGYTGESLYMPDEWTGGGIDYFLRSVWFHGIVGGDGMQALLEMCHATRIGREMIKGGRDQLVIYNIPANETDRQNGRGSLLVWLTVGNWRLSRTRLHSVYATEMTEFRMAYTDVQNDPSVYYSDYLPEDIYWSIDQYLLTGGTWPETQTEGVSYIGGQVTEGNALEDSGEGSSESGSSESSDSGEENSGDNG